MIQANTTTFAEAATGNRRRVQGQAAIATWALRRLRSLESTAVGPSTRVVEVMAAARCTAETESFEYAGRRAVVRPVVGRLLIALWNAGGCPIPAAQLCDAIYGRPASLRALRQSAFRASRVMDRVDCPLLVCCQSGHVFLKVRSWAFERAPGPAR